MPRVENLGPNVDRWHRTDAHGNGTSTYDVCAGHAAMLEVTPNAFNQKLRPYNGDPQGTEGWGGDAEHPSYDERAEEGQPYLCAVCRRMLTDARDG